MKADQASSTAYLIAESAAFLSQDEIFNNLLEPASVEISKRFADSRPFSKKPVYLLKQKRVLRPFFNALERLVIPGIQLHYLVRKRRIEEIARAALAENFRQIVVFGAGFDTLALRLHKDFPNVNFLEVDYPATQKAKLRVIKKHYPAGDNLKFAACDLTGKSFRATMSETEYFVPKTRTLFVAEGLTMYLDEPDVENLFEFVQANGAENSRFAFTFMEKLSNERIAFHNASKFVDFWLKRRGEPFRWGLSRAELIGFLEKKNFSLLELDDAETFRQKYLTAPELAELPLAVGESLCLARVN